MGEKLGINPEANARAFENLHRMWKYLMEKCPDRLQRHGYQISSWFLPDGMIITHTTAEANIQSNISKEHIDYHRTVTDDDGRSRFDPDIREGSQQAIDYSYAMFATALKDCDAQLPYGYYIG